MMQSSLPWGSLVFLNLQIIQRLLQVKTPMGGRGLFERISLGFKQLARGLHVPFSG
jgi:hypothetical protein